jgi:hypothetical protein
MNAAFPSGVPTLGRMASLVVYNILFPYPTGKFSTHRIFQKHLNIRMLRFGVALVLYWETSKRWFLRIPSYLFRSLVADLEKVFLGPLFLVEWGYELSFVFFYSSHKCKFYSEDTSTKSQWHLHKVKKVGIYSILIELEKHIWKMDTISWKENMICM